MGDSGGGAACGAGCLDPLGVGASLVDGASLRARLRDIRAGRIYAPGAQGAAAMAAGWAAALLE